MGDVPAGDVPVVEVVDVKAAEPVPVRTCRMCAVISKDARLVQHLASVRPAGPGPTLSFHLSATIDGPGAAAAPAPVCGMCAAAVLESFVAQLRRRR